VILAHIMGVPVEEDVAMLAGGLGAATAAAVLLRAQITRFVDRVWRRVWR